MKIVKSPQVRDRAHRFEFLARFSWISCAGFTIHTIFSQPFEGDEHNFHLVIGEGKHQHGMRSLPKLCHFLYRVAVQVSIFDVGFEV